MVFPRYSGVLNTVVRSQPSRPAVDITKHRKKKVTLVILCKFDFSFRPHSFATDARALRDSKRVWREEAVCLLRGFLRQ